MSRALDLVGERWALLVVRELLLGPKRFTDLRSGLPSVSPDVLSQRLRELEEAGIVRRDKLPPPAASRIYELTDRGQELEPVVLALGRWGSSAPFPEPERGAAFGADSAMIALKTLFTPISDLSDTSYELRLGEQRFRARVTESGLELARGSAEHPDATLETDPVTLSEVLWHGRKLTDAIRSGDLRIEGDGSAAKRFLAMFPPPAAPGTAPALTR